MDKKKIIIIMLFTIGIINPSEYTKTATIGEITDEEYRKELINSINSVFDISTKKLRNYVNEYKLKIDSTYEIENTLLIRHFFLETLEEINNDLRKGNKQYRINFSYVVMFQFEEEDRKYLMK